jgi:hypothetical protein
MIFPISDVFIVYCDIFDNFTNNVNVNWFRSVPAITCIYIAEFSLIIKPNINKNPEKRAKINESLKLLSMFALTTFLNNSYSIKEKQSLAPISNVFNMVIKIIFYL